MNTSFIHPESLLHFFFHIREGLKRWIYTQKIKNHALKICFYFVGNGIIGDPGYVTAMCHVIPTVHVPFWPQPLEKFLKIFLVF